MNSDIFNLILSRDHKFALKQLDELVDVQEKQLFNVLIEFVNGKFYNVIKLCDEINFRTSDSFLRYIVSIFKIRSEILIYEEVNPIANLIELEKEIVVSLKETNKFICLFYLYLVLIEYYMYQSLFDQAMEYLPKFDELLEKLDGRYLFYFFVIKGELLNYKGEFDESLKIFNECLLQFSDLNDLFYQSKIYYNIGAIYGKRGDIRNAKKMFYEVIELSSKTSNDYDLVKTFIGLSIVSNYQGNYQEAYNYFKYGLDLAKRNNYHRLENNLVSNRAGILFNEGKYLEAIEDYSKLLSYYVNTKNNSKIKHLLTCIGAAYSRLGSKDVALDYYEQMLEIDEPTVVDVKNIQLLINMSGIYIEIGSYDKAKIRIKQAQQLNNKFRSKQFDAHILLEYGKLNFQCGNFKEALDDLSASMDLFYSIENIRLYNSVKFHLAKLHRQLGNYQLSLRYLKECENLSSSSGNYNETSKILLLYFIIYLEIFRLDKAKEIVHKLNEIKFHVSNKLILENIDLSKALLDQILEGKTSKNEIKETYKSVLSNNAVDQEYYSFALIQFIEYLISELFVNDDDKYMKDIEKYLYQLYELMTQLSSPYLRCQTLILQYKISLAKDDMVAAELYLNEAHEVATAYGLSGKLTEISIENLKLTQQLSSM